MLHIKLNIIKFSLKNYQSLLKFEKTKIQIFMNAKNGYFSKLKKIKESGGKNSLKLFYHLYHVGE